VRGSARLLPSLVALLLIGLAPVVAEAAELRLRAALDPPVLALGEVGRLVIEASGSGLDGPRLAPRFELDNLEQVGPASYGQQVSVGTGGSRWQRTWTIPVRGLALGPAGVRDIAVAGVQPEPTAAPVTVEVVAERPPGSTPRRSPTLDEVEKLLGRHFPDPFFDRPRHAEPAVEPRVLLRTTVDETRPFVGQRVRLTTWLYTQAPVRRLEKLAAPSFEGFWTENLEVHPVEEKENVEWQGEGWLRAPIERRWVQPLRAGELWIEPLEVQVWTQALERGFFRSRAVPRELRLASEPVRFEVRPLPPLPADLAMPFSGAVGRIDLAARLVPNRLEVGKGASLTVTATGPGVFAGITAPVIASPGAFRITPGPADGGDLEERGRSWSFVVEPREAGRRALPPLEMVYFDPTRELYQVARAELPAVDVRPAATVATVAEAPLAPPVVPGVGTAARVLPWAVGGPALLGLAVLVLRRRRGAAGELPSEVRAEFAAALERARGEERPRRAAREIEDAWRQLFTAVPDGPASESPPEWPAAFARRGAAPEVVAELERVVGDLTYLRHAPELATTGSLVAELTARSERLAGRLGARRSLAAT
jgi:hypothetical protein